MIGKSAVAGNIGDETVVQRSMKWWYTSTSSHGSAASCVLSVSIDFVLTSERVTNAERAQVQDVSSGVRVPGVPVEITGKKDSEVEIALRVAKKSDMVSRRTRTTKTVQRSWSSRGRLEQAMWRVSRMSEVGTFLV